MITQELCPHKAPESKRQRHNKPLVQVGSNDHKKIIYDNVMAQIYNREDLYWYGSEHISRGKEVIVINYCTYGEAEWDGMKCKPIEVWSNRDNDFFLVHPSDLKPIR